MGAEEVFINLSSNSYLYKKDEHVLEISYCCIEHYMERV